MANYTTFDDLERFAKDKNESLLRRSAAAASGEKNLFLSYSSADNKWLPGVISVLQDHGARVYIDREDGQLPRTPSQETARLLRKAIQACRRFVLFVSTNTKDSSWIPWELGISDGSRGDAGVALFPVASSRDDQGWAEQEYLGLYRRIVWGLLGDDPKPQWFVHDHRTNMGTALGQWIASG